jgi:hypothetical protein
MELNPELKKGDRVQALHFEGGGERDVTIGTWGTVINIGKTPWENQYMVRWDDGDQENEGNALDIFALLDSGDIWTKTEIRRKRRKSIEESKKKRISERYTNSNLVKYFQIKNSSGNRETFLQFLVEFLIDLRDSSIVNMFQAKPFLYMGSSYIERHYGDQSNADDEAFERVLENADKARDYMIMATMNYLEDNGYLDSNAEYDEDEEDDKVLSMANRTIPKMADIVFDTYMKIHKNKR